MKYSNLCAAILLIVVQCHLTAAYLPGIDPTNYVDGTEVPVEAVKLTSVHTQLPYKYYDLPFGKNCRPAKEVFEKEQLGEVLRGDRVENSLYHVSY